MTYMPYGKYKDWDIEDIPLEYLNWFIDNVDPENEKTSKLLDDIESEIQYRESNQVKF